MGSISWLKSSHLEICKPKTALDVPRSEKMYGSAVPAKIRRKTKKEGQKSRTKTKIFWNYQFFGIPRIWEVTFSQMFVVWIAWPAYKTTFVDTYLPSSSFPPTSSTVGLRETAHFVPFTRLGAILGRRAKSRTWRINQTHVDIICTCLSIYTSMYMYISQS